LRHKIALVSDYKSLNSLLSDKISERARVGIEQSLIVKDNAIGVKPKPDDYIEE